MRGSSPRMTEFLFRYGPGSAAHQAANSGPLRCVRGTLILLRLPCQALQQFLDLAVLLALAVGPFADHLLLGAHMRDQAFDRLRKVGHRRRGAAVAAAFFDCSAQLVDRVLQIAAGASGAFADISLY